MWYRDTAFSLEELANIKGRVTKECWKYLVGLICKRESDRRREHEPIHAIYEQMGKVLGYTGKSMVNVVRYSKSIERIQEFLPNIAADILNGKTRLSAKDTIVLAKMDFLEIHTVIERIESENTLVRIIIDEQKALRKKTNRPGRPVDEAPRASVKDMPPYNPDAQINALAYTIPSWISMAERTVVSSRFSETSSDARDRLLEELTKLASVTKNISLLLMEDK
jgi:hypothetical protein